MEIGVDIRGTPALMSGDDDQKELTGLSPGVISSSALDLCSHNRERLMAVFGPTEGMWRKRETNTWANS